MFSRTARKSRSERNCSGFFLCRGIIKRCTPLGSKCTPHRPFVKWYRGVKRKRLHCDHFRITVEPVIVKRYRKTLANRGFCKKKLDTRFDTHCIKTGVQLWCGHGDSNPNALLHENLNLACLPIPSCPRGVWRGNDAAIFFILSCQRGMVNGICRICGRLHNFQAVRFCFLTLLLDSS